MWHVSQGLLTEQTPLVVDAEALIAPLEEAQASILVPRFKLYWVRATFCQDQCSSPAVQWQETW